ncbi:nucleocapsid protein [Coleopteran phasma-related virus OKIAV235]|uniref:Nucleocapsid protein n=1 Tax=Coleopteran phasma-related virus OKIAV235 TaxID=2746309 RepID=A0A7D7JQ42_9VIRU|nr:nucleocapsid protein [Coleopteran phasma-related virus OKIAV235]QMP82274.1 nucleocapsid protein [Coleopteran phasma-related virus OKIAV235]
MSQPRAVLDFSELRAQLKFADNEENKTAFNLTGLIPDELAKHTTEKTYTLAGITPDEFIDHHGAMAFDFPELQAEFSTICEDYIRPLDPARSSYAVDFCSRVIYEIAPDSRKGKRTENKTYRLKFIYKDGIQIKIKTCLVSTYRGVDYKKNYIPNERICLTVRLASMLAVVILNQLVPIAINREVVLLTPLAGACFSKDDLYKMADDMNVTIEDLIKDLNSGCQSGGQHLPNGYLHIALCSAIVATKGLKDDRMRDGIISKTMKQYYQVKKPLDDAKYTITAGYATGGIPGSLSIKGLIAQYDTAQTLAAKQLAKASAQSTLTTTVNVPASTSRLPTNV